MFNIVYADRHDTIFYISNAKLPLRNPDPAYNWKETLPGNTSATLWTKFKPVAELPQYTNPASGFLFNTNHSPFLATDEKSNLNAIRYDLKDGFETYHNNRSARVTELMKGVDKMDYDHFKKIKFDRQYPEQFVFPYGIDSLINLSVAEYPLLKEVITQLQQWDHRAVVNSKGAAVFLLAYEYISKQLKNSPARELTKAESVETYQYINDYMLTNFGTVDLTLGDIQKLARGNDARPGDGLPDILAAAYSKPYINGTRNITTGDAYICFVRYPKTGLPIIESINTFGASQHPNSPHYKDQMTMFQNQQTKHMTLDKKEVLQYAEKIYHPVLNKKS
jgi:acyl-homoserine-lactone acylase